MQYHILEHDAEANKQLYDGLLQKLKEATISVGLRSSNIRVGRPGAGAHRPSRPQKARNILLAFLVGIIGGIGLAIFREYLDNTVKSPDDIEALTGLAVAGRGSCAAGIGGSSEPILVAGARIRCHKQARDRAWNCCHISSRNRKFRKRFGRCERHCCFHRPSIRPK